MCKKFRILAKQNILIDLMQSQNKTHPSMFKKKKVNLLHFDFCATQTASLTVYRVIKINENFYSLSIFLEYLLIVSFN